MKSFEAKSRGQARRCVRVVTLRLSTLDFRPLHSNSTEQSENVYENKGSLRKTGDEAGMYMKTSNLAVNCYIQLKTHELITACSGDKRHIDR